jgi:molecular chaperone Hsp33
MLHQLLRHVAGWHPLLADADGRARGLLLQQLPADRLKDEEERAASWQHVTALASTLTAEELLGLDNETVLHRLYHEEQVRLFDVQPLRFRCSCSRERSAMRWSAWAGRCARPGGEHGGEVEIDCQFCNQRYLFDASRCAQLFAGAARRRRQIPVTKTVQRR